MANPGVWGSLGEGENSQAMGREGNWEQDRNRRDTHREESTAFKTHYITKAS